jgi:glycine/D-amino acid oxidase-like deaminating enzyme
MVSSTSRKVGALIIGGGIIGLAIGYYLAKKNYCNVEIVERESELTIHASGHNAGGLASPHLNKPRELWPLFMESRRLYDELVDAAGFEFDFVRGGTIIPGTAQEALQFEETAHLYENVKDGIQVEFLNAKELQEKEPNLSRERFRCALYYPLDAQGNSKKLASCFSKVCVEKGVTVTTGSEVSGFEISNGRVLEVKTQGSTIIPDTVIVAAGPWSGEISRTLGLNLPMSPVKGHLISIEAGDQRLVNSFISGPDYYVMQNGSSIVVGGGEDSVGFDSNVNPKRVSDAWQEGVSMVPNLEFFKEKGVAAACLRPYAEGGAPILGKSDRLANVIFATGHFRNGFGLAPATGELISQLILEDRSDLDLTAFSPDRFPRNY